MLNTTMKLSNVMFFLLLVSGCGGSGGGSSVAPEQVATDQVIDVEPELVEPTSLAMADLVANEDFTFANKNQIDVLLDLPEYNTQRGYVSVYKAYQQLDSDRFYPDSTSRVISGALVNGLFEQSFASINNQQQYLIEVWFYDGQEPVQKVLALTGNQLIF